MWVDRLDRHPELGLVDLHMRSARRDDVSVNRGLWKGFGTDRGLSKGHAERGRARKSGNQMAITLASPLMAETQCSCPEVSFALMRVTVSSRPSGVSSRAYL